MKPLSPSLSDIAASLSGDGSRDDGVIADATKFSDLADVVPLNWQEVPVSDAVRSRISSHISARDLARNVAPQRGDIVLVSRAGAHGNETGRDIAVVVGVLLNERIRAEAWQGFIVAGEIEYVGEFDVLIEETDEPVDPAVCFIQVWNPVTVLPDTNVRLLGRLSEGRLNAIADVKDECELGKAHNALPPSLTRIGLRQLASGSSVRGKAVPPSRERT